MLEENDERTAEEIARDEIKKIERGIWHMKTQNADVRDLVLDLALELYERNREEFDVKGGESTCIGTLQYILENSPEEMLRDAWQEWKEGSKDEYKGDGPNFFASLTGHVMIELIVHNARFLYLLRELYGLNFGSEIEIHDEQIGNIVIEFDAEGR